MVGPPPLDAAATPSLRHWGRWPPVALASRRLSAIDLSSRRRGSTDQCRRLIERAVAGRSPNQQDSPINGRPVGEVPRFQC